MSSYSDVVGFFHLFIVGLLLPKPLTAQATVVVLDDDDDVCRNKDDDDDKK